MSQKVKRKLGTPSSVHCSCETPGCGVNERVTTPRTLRVRSLNVCGCGTDEMKREVTGRMFVRRKLGVLVMSELKMKGKGGRELMVHC